MEIYFVRHGQTVWNVEKRFQGLSDSPLTELGITQAKFPSLSVQITILFKYFFNFNIYLMIF